MDFTIDMTRIMEVIVGLVFTGVLIPIGKEAWKWIRSKVKNEKLQAAMDEAERVAAAAVANLQNNLVDGYKAAAPDGKLTADQIAEVSGKALTQFMADISAGALQTLKDNKPNLESYIASLITEKLEALKVARKTASAISATSK